MHSANQQREKQTIDSQLSALPKYAKKHGYSIYKTYKDDGISGTSIAARPAFSQLLDDCTKGLFQAILVIEHNRITRSDNPEEVGRISRIFMENDIKIISPVEGILDLKRPPDELVAWIKMWIAKEERKEILRKIARGKRYKQEQGYWLGKSPYGYAFAKETKTWSFVEKEKELIKWMHRKFLNDGWSLRKICEELHRRGQKGRQGKTLAHQTLCYLFRNEAYTGHLYANRYIFKGSKRIGERPRAEWVEYQPPALISRRTYNKILKRLAALKKSGRPAVQGRYLFQGMLKCGLCGSRMRVHKNQWREYYVCHNRSESREYARSNPDKKRCSLPLVRADKFDPGLFEFIIKQLSNPDVLKREIARANFSPGRLEQLEKKKKKLAREDRKIEKKIANLLSVIEDLPKKEAHERIWERKEEGRQIAYEIEEIEKQLTTAREGDGRMKEIERHIDEVGRHLWDRIFEAMIELGPEYLRKVVEALFLALSERITVRPSKFKSSPFGSGVTASWTPHLNLDLISEIAQRAKLGESLKSAFDHSFKEREASAKEVVRKARRGKKPEAPLIEKSTRGFHLFSPP